MSKKTDLTNKIKADLQFYLENELIEELCKEPQNNLKRQENSHQQLSHNVKAIKEKIVKKTNIQNSFAENLQESEAFLTDKNETKMSSYQEERILKTNQTVNLNLKNGSTGQAIAALARRQQNNFSSFSLSSKISTTQMSANYLDSFERGSGFDNSASKEFLSLEEIIANAKNLASLAQNLEELQKIVGEFEGCNLKKMATNTVFCDGNKQSRIMIIGEAPGNHEDLQGIPFCGDSGELLTQMLKAINLNRQTDYYITNALFWRPPGNRKPTEEELKICAPFVHRQIQLIAPKILILVGATAMNAILKISDPISKIRGQIRDFSPEYLNSPTTSFTIFHPSFLMRQPAKKKLAWLDMLTLEKFIQKNL